MAYASSSSPFASVKGPNVFGGSHAPSSFASVSASVTAAAAAATTTTTSTGSVGGVVKGLSAPWVPPNQQTSGLTSTFNPSPFAYNPIPIPIPSPLSPSKNTTGTVVGGGGISSSPGGQKRSGFEAFASSISTFGSAAKRPKSPEPPHSHVHALSPFGSHATGSGGGGGGGGGVLFGRSKSPPLMSGGGGVGGGRQHNQHGHGQHGHGHSHSPSPVPVSRVGVNAFSAYANSGSGVFGSSLFAGGGNGGSSGGSSSAGTGTPGGVFGSSTLGGGRGGGGVFGNGGDGGSGSGGEDEGGDVFRGGERNGFGYHAGGNGKVSFGERLRAAGKDGDGDEEGLEKKKVALTEQDGMFYLLRGFYLFRDCVMIWGLVLTGEEDEETVYQVRGKLFALSPQNQWKERGTGTIRLNVRRDDGSGARLGELFCSFFFFFVGRTLILLI